MGVTLITNKRSRSESINESCWNEHWWTCCLLLFQEQQVCQVISTWLLSPVSSSFLTVIFQTTATKEMRLFNWTLNRKGFSILASPMNDTHNVLPILSDSPLMRTFSALIYTLSSIANGKRFGDTMYRTVLCWPSNKQNGSLLGHNSLLMGVHPSAVVGVERHFHRASARIHRADWKQEDPCRSKRNHGKARKEKES